jgi:hypothetical protein
VRAQSWNLRALGRTHPTGGVGGFPELSHTPADLSIADRPSPGPRGHGDPPPAGLPVVLAALRALPRLRSGPRLLQPPVSARRPRPQSARRRAPPSAEPRGAPRPPRSPAGLPRPLPRPRDASDFPRCRRLWHPPGVPAPRRPCRASTAAGPEAPMRQTPPTPFPIVGPAAPAVGAGAPSSAGPRPTPRAGSAGDPGSARAPERRRLR